MQGSARQLAGIAVAIFMAWPLTAGADRAVAAKGADLTVTPPAIGATTVVQGGSLAVTDVTSNAGRAKARRSTTEFLLSADRKADGGDAVLGSRPVKALKPRKRSKGPATLRIPGIQAPGSYLVIACADAADRVKEKKSAGRNNCRPSKAALAVSAAGPEAPSSFALIAQALAAGEITADEALLYRVYALFGDPRLPERFAGAGATEDDALFEAAERWQSLPAEIREKLAPFLVAPQYEGSWAEPAAARRPGAKRAGDGTDPVDVCQAHGSFVARGWDSANTAAVRIWFRKNSPTDAQAAKNLAADLDGQGALPAIAAKVFEVMGAPAPDGGKDQICRGEDNRVDIVFAPLTGAYGVASAYDIPEGEELLCPTASFILLAPGMNRELTAAAAAHELFHVVQFDHSTETCFANTWVKESTATWVQDHVFGKQVQQEHDFAGWFLLDHRRSLFYEPPEEDPAAVRIYGAYLFWQFVVRKLGAQDAIIKVLETNADVANRVHRVQEAIVGALGDPDEYFPDFVTALWNKPPVETFKEWDSLGRGATPDVEYTVSVPDDGTPQSFQGFGDLEPFSYYIESVDFNESVRQVEWKPSTVPGLSERALVLIDGSWHGPIDLDSPRTWCRFNPSEDVDQMVLFRIFTQTPGSLGGVALGDGSGKLTARADCPTILEGTLTYTVTDDNNINNFSGGTGERHRRKTATLGVSLIYDEAEQEWLNLASTGTYSGSGTSHQTWPSHSCVFDDSSSYSGTAPPWGFIDFFISGDTAYFAGSIEGNESRTSTTTGQPSCGDLGTHTSDNVDLILPKCHEGVVTRDPSTGKLTVDFNWTDSSTYSFSGSSGSGTVTETCRGRLTQG